MNRRLRKFAVAVSCGAILFIAALIEPTGILRGIACREAFYRNRPSSYWSNQLRADLQDGELSDELVDQLSANHLAAPVLKECLSDEDPDIRCVALLLLARRTFGQELESELRRALNDPDPDVQFVAIRALGQMGANAMGPAVETLIGLRQNNDPAIATAADTALWQIAPNVAGNYLPWKAFRSAQWQFSAAMPGQPSEKITTMETPTGNVTTHTFMVQFGLRNFSVAVSAYPAQTENAFTVQERYDSIAATAPQFFAEQLGVDVEADQKLIKYNGHSAVEQTIRVADGTIMRIRSFLVGPRSYLIQCVSPGHEIVHPAELEYFYDSFRLDYRPKPPEPLDESSSSN